MKREIIIIAVTIVALVMMARTLRQEAPPTDQVKVVPTAHRHHSDGGNCGSRNSHNKSGAGGQRIND